MIPYADYHMHTPLCGHATGSPEEYVKQALKIGLKEIGFSDHAPMVHKPMPGITMSLEELPKYYDMIEDVRKRYASQINIKIALESDFLPGYENKTKSIIDSYPYDYIIGSVHFIDDWAFDDPASREYWKKYDVNEVYRKYYALLRQSAKTGFFQIIGHCDLPKKFGARPSVDLSDEIIATAKVFKNTGVAIEINTAGLRKPIAEMYPAPHCLKIYREAGVPLTFGSDAHDPQHVGNDFDKAVDLAKLAGYSEYLLFKNCQIEKRIKI
jgi:histidinol-phosphatase (PHP family)